MDDDPRLVDTLEDATGGLWENDDVDDDDDGRMKGIETAVDDEDDGYEMLEFVSLVSDINDEQDEDEVGVDAVDDDMECMGTGVVLNNDDNDDDDDCLGVGMTMLLTS